jgi:RimJ/RimL family protein N-acetyltransferase
MVGLHHIESEHRCAQVAYELDIEHRGKGLMTEALECLVAHAFGELAFHRLEARVDPGNAPSIALAQKLGFVREGVLRENHWEDGRFHDTIVFGLVHKDSVTKT